MSTVLHPVGPQRARVYWVRRLLVILLVAAFVVLAGTVVSWVRGRGADPGAAAAVEQPGGDGDARSSATDDGTDVRSALDGEGGEGADAASSDAGAQDEDGEDAASALTPVDCTPEALQLTLTSSEVEFAATANPVLTATVTNVGDVPCTVDAGDATREVLITSGDDRVWSSKDCATEETASRQLLLNAGGADAVAVEWARVRSAEACPADLPAPKAGTYQAVATLGGLSSQTVVFILE